MQKLGSCRKEWEIHSKILFESHHTDTINPYHQRERHFEDTLTGDLQLE